MQTGELGVFKVIGKEAIEEGEQAEEEEKEDEEEEEKEDEEEEEGKKKKKRKKTGSYNILSYVPALSHSHRLVSNWHNTFHSLYWLYGVGIFPCYSVSLQKRFLSCNLSPIDCVSRCLFWSCCARLFFCSHDALT